MLVAIDMVKYLYAIDKYVACNYRSEQSLKKLVSHERIESPCDWFLFGLNY